MSDRIVRDELLTSERYWGVSPEARNLYLSILLTVDDAARMSGSLFGLRTKCMASTVSHERVIALLSELIDHDLVRRYEIGTTPYLFVPRFRNRRRYIGSSKHPAPPSEINDITEKKADSGHPRVNLKSVPSQPRVSPKTRGVGVGVGVGVKAFDFSLQKSLVGLAPDPAPPEPKKRKPKTTPNPEDQKRRQQENADALQALEFLNLKARRAFRPVPANISPIVARLREGFTLQDCRSIVAKKVREWGTDEKMALYLRPKTLFTRTNFANYAGELVDPTEERDAIVS